MRIMEDFELEELTPKELNEYLIDVMQYVLYIKEYIYEKENKKSNLEN